MAGFLNDVSMVVSMETMLVKQFAFYHRLYQFHSTECRIVDWIELDVVRRLYRKLGDNTFLDRHIGSTPSTIAYMLKG